MSVPLVEVQTLSGTDALFSLSKLCYERRLNFWRLKDLRMFKERKTLSRMDIERGT